MICSLCPKVALYQVRGSGFCRDHKAEGIAAEKKRLDKNRADRIMRGDYSSPSWGGGGSIGKPIRREMHEIIAEVRRSL